MIKKLELTKNDDNAFQEINFDKNKIENLNYNYKNLLIPKPWGNEYLFYSSKELSIWILKIFKNKKTSLHCHTDKKTSLIVLEGKAKLNNLNGSIDLNIGDCTIIEKKVFHRTSAEFNEDILIMEIETPIRAIDTPRKIILSDPI